MANSLQPARSATGPALAFRILGPLEVTEDGRPLPLGPYKQRALLALMLVNANEVVWTDRILDALWGEEAAGKQNALWVHLSQLRSTLEPNRSRAESSILLSRPAGYLLSVDHEQIDARRFERMRREGRDLLRTDPLAAGRLLRDALAMWHGAPLQDFLYEDFAQQEIMRLEELRLGAIEDRIEADLGAGFGPELVGEVEALAREHPLRERFTGQLMLALYRAGRQADALRAHQRLEATLIDSLDVQPSPELAELRRRIIAHDPALLVERAASDRPLSGVAIRGYELRDEIGRGRFGMVFRTLQRVVGREVAIKVIRPELANDRSFIRRFEAEARLVATLEHPHVVPLYDYWREPNGAYLVMPLMRGGSLATLLEQERLGEESAARIIGQVAGALSAAHRAGIIHGDIRPSNILLDGGGDAHLGDFGMARLVAPPDRSARGAEPEPPYAPPEYRERHAATPQADIYGLGVVLREMLAGSARGQLLQPGATGTLLAIADRAAAPAPHERYPDVESFLVDLTGAGTFPAESVAPAAAANPYRGLRPFGESDAAAFFGRERLVERLVAHVDGAGLGGRFLVLVGPSGSGKSSALRAGLLPALRRGAVPGSERWFVAEMAPGRRPFEELVTVLLGVAVEPQPGLFEQLSSDPSGLRRAVEGLLPDDGSELVLVVDQLEQLFTLTDDEPTRRRFCDAIRAAVVDDNSRIRLLATLRADFYDRPLNYHDFGELLRAGTEVITPMSPEELERAVAGPAERVGGRLEPGLVATVVADVADRPSALPLMQYAMTEVFERRSGSMLELDAYRDIGGVAGALAHRAEELYTSLISPAQAVARQVFLRLVTVREGTEGVGQPVLRSELRAMAPLPAAVDEVLELFGRHRLLTFDRDAVSRGPTVELAHESLLHEWPRLAGWIRDAQADLRLRSKVAAAAAEWERGGQDPGELLAGRRLAEVEAWQGATDLALSDLETRFIGASSRQASADLRARRRRRRVVGGVASVVSVSALALGVLAISQGLAADRLATVERINRLIESADDALPSDPELGLLLGLAAAEEATAHGLDVFPENLEVLHEGLRSHRLVFGVPGVADAVFSPDGESVYLSLADGGISVRDASSGDERAELAGAVLGPSAGALAISGDGRWLTSGYWVLETTRLRDAPLSWSDTALGIADVAITGDGSLIAVARFERGRIGEGVVAVLDRRSGQELWSIGMVPSPVRVAFSPDGARLAVADSPPNREQSVLLFDTSTGARLEVIAVPDQAIGLAFHPDGSRLLVGGDRVIRYWDLERSAFAPRVDGGHRAEVTDIALSTDGAVVASSDVGGVVVVRGIRTGERLFALPTHEGVIDRTALSADGSRLATVTIGSTDGPGRLRVFDISLSGGRDLSTIPTTAALPATVAIDQSGTLIGVGDYADGRRQVWSVDGELRHELPVHAPFSESVSITAPIAFSADGLRLATGDADGVVRLWDVETASLVVERDVREIAPTMGDTLGSATGVGDAVFDLVFSPDEQLLAVAGAGFVLVADAATLDDGRVLHESTLTWSQRLAFSPDGSRIVAGRLKGVPGTQELTIPAAIVWDVATGEEVGSYASSEQIPAVDYSPAGDLIAVATGVISILDADTFDVRLRLTADSHEIWDVAFSPDGEQLAAAYGDGRIGLWQARQGELLYTLDGHDGPTADLDWTADGHQLVSVGSDGSVRIYAMHADALMELARARVTRQLTVEECRQYLSASGC